MSTLVNHLIQIQAPKGVIPDLAAEGRTPNNLVRIGAFFEACAGGMSPGFPGETRIRIAKGSTNAALAPAYAKVTLALVPAQGVVEVNGVPFTAVAGAATAGNNEFDQSGADTADASALAAAILASTSAGVLGQVQAGNLACTVQCTSVAAGDFVEVNGRRYTATAYPTGRVGEFSIIGTDTADATALAAALNADAAFSAVALAESSTDTVTIRQRTGTTGLLVRKSAATFTLGGLTASRLAAVAVVLISALILGVAGNALTVKTLGIPANGTVTYVAPSGAQTIVIDGTTAYSAAAGASAALTATAAAAAINAHATIGQRYRALARAGVVWIFDRNPGVVGNATRLSVTGTGATASGARLTGGTTASSEGAVASGTVTITGGSGATAAVINGVSVSVTWATSDNNTATLLANAINASADPLVYDHVTATAATNVVTIKASRGGTRGNTISLAGTGTGVVASGAALASGAAPTTIVPSTDRLASGVGGDASAPVTYSF